MEHKKWLHSLAENYFLHGDGKWLCISKICDICKQNIGKQYKYIFIIIIYIRILTSLLLKTQYVSAIM